MSLRQLRLALAAAAAALLLPATLHAHLVNTGLGPFYDGVSHFALTPEDLLPALALALFAGQRGARLGPARARSRSRPPGSRAGSSA